MPNKTVQWTEKQIEWMKKQDKEPYTLKKDLTMNNKKPNGLLGKNTQLEAIKKNLNIMASTVTKAVTMIDNLAKINIRMSKRIGDLEDKVKNIPASSHYIEGQKRGSDKFGRDDIIATEGEGFVQGGIGISGNEVTTGDTPKSFDDITKKVMS